MGVWWVKTENGRKMQERCKQWKLGCSQQIKTINTKQFRSANRGGANIKDGVRRDKKRVCRD